MKSLLKILLLIMVLIMPQNTYAKDKGAFTVENVKTMVRDIKEYVRSEDQTRPHPIITEVVEKHVPIGADQKQVITAFKKAGFEIRDFTDRDFSQHKLEEHDKIMRFSSEMWLFPDYFWGHKYGISVYFKNQKVSHRSGRAFHNFWK